MNVEAIIVRVYKVSVFYGAFLLFAVGSLLYNAFCFLLSFIPGSSKNRLSFHQNCGAALLRFYFWFIQKAGLCTIRHPNRELLDSIPPCIVIANHTGLMDAVIMNTFFPASACVFKSKLTRNPCVSHILKSGGHLNNDEGIDMIRQGVDMLKTGRKVVIFPEGTRNRNTDNLCFKKGFALMAQRASVPVTLFAIHNPSHAFSKEIPLLQAPELPFVLTFEYITQVELHPGESVDAFVSRVESIYRTLFNPSHAAIASENHSG